MVLTHILHNNFPHFFSTPLPDAKWQVLSLACFKSALLKLLLFGIDFSLMIKFKCSDDFALMMDISREMEDARTLLVGLTTKKPVSFLKRGNEAIKQALLHAKNQGCTRLLIPDQGGWLTYPQFGKKLGFDITHFETKDGVFGPEVLVGDHKTVVLINSLPAYAFNLDMQAITNHCKKHNILLINDVAASIGTKDATYGDIIIGSFGKAKPLPLDEGGFIAGVKPTVGEPDIDYETLTELLKTLPTRTKEALNIAKKIKMLLPNISNPEHNGYVVIAPFTTDAEKEMLINLVEKQFPNIEYTICPRYIRVTRQAVSFEVKRLFTK